MVPGFGFVAATAFDGEQFRASSPIPHLVSKSMSLRTSEQTFRFRDQGPGFPVPGSRFMVPASGFRVPNSRLTCRASTGLTDFSQVDILASWNTLVHFGTEKSPTSPNW